MPLVETARPVVWPADDAILLAVTDGSRYNQALLQVATALLARFQDGVVISANRPYHAVRDAATRAGLDASRLRFVDCVSSLTGMPPPPDPQAAHIESPTLLEKMAMRTEQVLRRLPSSKFLLLDSLSTLAVYNGPKTVAELTHNLVTRLRLQHIPAALLLVQQGSDGELEDTVRPLCDGVLRL